MISLHFYNVSKQIKSETILLYYIVCKKNE